MKWIALCFLLISSIQLIAQPSDEENRHRIKGSISALLLNFETPALQAAYEYPLTANHNLTVQTELGIYLPYNPIAGENTYDLPLYGYRSRVDLRFYYQGYKDLGFTREEGRFSFIGLQGLWRDSYYSKTGTFSRDNGQYFQEFDYTQNTRSYGIYFIQGQLLPINSRWEVELQTGYGIYWRYAKDRGVPDDAVSTDNDFIAILDYDFVPEETQTIPSFYFAIRLNYRLGE